jgi:hypothetical protein
VRQTTRKVDIERIQHYVPDLEMIINSETEDLSYEEIDGESLVNVYTDGSLLDG